MGITLKGDFDQVPTLTKSQRNPRDFITLYCLDDSTIVSDVIDTDVSDKDEQLIVLYSGCSSILVSVETIDCI